jgi:DNA-binding MarR family transcriptional regulator
LTVVQLGILADLDRAGALHLRELARRQGCRRQSVDEAIRSLAVAGWIRRIPTADRRLSRWVLEPEGAAQLGRVRDRVGGFPPAALARILTIDGRELCWEW